MSDDVIMKCIDACYVCDYEPIPNVIIPVDHIKPLIVCLHMDPCPADFNETLQKLKEMWNGLLDCVSEEDLILYVIDVFRKCE